MTGVCNGGVCVCSEDTHCSNGYCDKGTVSIGANQCKAFKANDEGCTRAGQCASGRCYLGKCKPQDECQEDRDCRGNQYCDKGTAGIGRNVCKTDKALGDACSRAGQCASNCCKVYNFKLQCRPTSKCN